MPRYALHGADARVALRELVPGSVQTCVTSPPYWGLRDYGFDGQLGLEATAEAYLSELAGILDLVRDALHETGTLWLNLGDTYYTGAGGQRLAAAGGGVQGGTWAGPAVQPNRARIPGLEPKNLMGIPWRVAFRLQADGWILRSEIIWEKPNATPESANDRPARCHEHVFLLAKAGDYYYDREAIRERSKSAGRKITGGLAKGQVVGELRNRRTVWTIPKSSFRGHRAAMPVELARMCVLAGSPEGSLVLDPFMGSGSTGVAALNAGRRFVGIDGNAEYVELARERVELECSQGSLFYPGGQA